MKESNHTMMKYWILLDRADTNHKLLLKEMLHINRIKPELNIKEQSELF